MRYASTDNSPKKNYNLLDPKQAAEYAYCSVSTIKRRIYSGELPAVRNGRKLYVERADIDSLFKPVAVTEDERLNELARLIASQAPALSPERKAKLASLLS